MASSQKKVGRSDGPSPSLKDFSRKFEKRRDSGFFAYVFLPGPITQVEKLVGKHRCSKCSTAVQTQPHLFKLPQAPWKMTCEFPKMFYSTLFFPDLMEPPFHTWCCSVQKKIRPSPPPVATTPLPRSYAQQCTKPICRC